MIIHIYTCTYNIKITPDKQIVYYDMTDKNNIYNMKSYSKPVICKVGIKKAMTDNIYNKKSYYNSKSMLYRKANYMTTYTIYIKSTT